MTTEAAGTFGAGGGEPWSAVLGGSGGSLELRPEQGPPQTLDVGRWSAAADAADRTVLEGLDGPVLDVGCGPGRMVRAALDAGLDATGIDVERAAIDLCVRQGLPVLRRSVFDPLPREGGWGAVLLIDGNVGIGGDPGALLERCRLLLRPGGRVVAEVDADPARDAAFIARVADDEAESDPFPWAEAGEHALRRAAGALVLERAWSAGGRRFLRLRRG